MPPARKRPSKPSRPPRGACDAATSLAPRGEPIRLAVAARARSARLRRWVCRGSLACLPAHSGTGDLGSRPSGHDDAFRIGFGDTCRWSMGASLSPQQPALVCGGPDGGDWLCLRSQLCLLAAADRRIRGHAQPKLGRCQSLLALGARSARGSRRWRGPLVFSAISDGTQS